MVRKEIIGRIPVYFGDWDANATYGKKNRVTKDGSEFESKIEGNIGHDPIVSVDENYNVIFDTTNWYVISNGSSAYYAAQKIAAMQNQIDALIAAGSEVSLSISPNVIYKNTSTNVNVSSTITKTIGTVTSHVVKRGDATVASGTGMSVSGTDSVNAASNQTYVTTIVVNGLTISPKSATLYCVDRIYYGQGATTATPWNTASPRTSPAGQYDFTISANGNGVFFDVPPGMTINSMATPEGLPIPYTNKASTEHSGYTTYYTTNTYDAGEVLKVVIR